MPRHSEGHGNPLSSRGPERQFTFDWIASNLHTLVTLATGFFAVRLLAHNVPRPEYGFWLMAGSIGGYLLIVQRGTSAALMRAGAEAWGRQQAVQAGHSFQLLLSLLGLYLGLGVVASTGGAWAISAIYQAPVARLAFWTFLYTCASMMLGAANAYLGGLGWFAAGRVFLMASALANLVLTLLCVNLSLALWTLPALQTGVTLTLAVLGVWLAARRLGRLVRPRVHLAGIRETVRLLYAGTGFLLTDLGYMIAYQSDSILVGSLLGPAQVVPLSILQRIAGTLQTVLGAQNAPLLPTIMRMHAAGELSQIRTAYLTQMRRFGGVAIIFAWGICCCGRDVVSFWVGKEFYAGWAVNFWIAIAFLVVALYRPTGLTLCGIGEERRCGLMAIAEALVNVGLSIILIRQMGMMGTVLATVLSQLAVTHLPLLGLLSRRLRIPLRSFLPVVLGPWIPALVLLGVATPIAALGPDSFFWRSGVVGVASAAGLVLGWRRAWGKIPADSELCLAPPFLASRGQRH
jgi:O-antigen/teichoic acid export membrane protein